MLPYNTQGHDDFRKTAYQIPSVPDGGWSNAALGAVIGGAAGLGLEAASNKERKNYLRKMLLFAALGGAKGMAASYLGAPDIVASARPYVQKAKNKIVGTVGGAINGYKKASSNGGYGMTRYERGFVNKCAEYGINGEVLLKVAQQAESEEDKYIKRREKLKLILSTLIGGAAGASMYPAKVVAKDRIPKGRDALIGALLGGATGLGVGVASNKLRGWAGLDPLIPTVATAKK